MTNDAARNRRKGPAKQNGHDLTSALLAWEFDEDNSVRRIKADDGREVIQVRLPLGLEQYELDGRPDGKRPLNHESWLHYYWAQAKSRRAEDAELTLGDDDFARLEQEGLLYYYRYLLFFQMQEYRLCARDTRRNLKLLDFVAAHSSSERAEMLEQYRPYILRMNVMARALFKVRENEDIQSALRLLQSGVKAIRGLAPLPENQVFEFERSRSLKSLEELIAQLEAHAPKNVALENELERAIREENYERAAVLRDELAALKKSSK